MAKQHALFKAISHIENSIDASIAGDADGSLARAFVGEIFRGLLGRREMQIDEM